jgi:hypothetical protein
VSRNLIGNVDGVCAAEMCGYEPCGLVERRVRLVETSVVVLVDVREVATDLQRDVDVVGTRAAGQADRVVEQELVRADLDQQRREPGEVGEQRAGQGLRTVAGAEVELDEGLEVGLDEDRVDAGLAPDARAAQGEVDPGGEQDCGGRLRESGFARREQGGEGQAAAGRVAGDDDVARVDAGCQELAVAGDSVLDG